MRSHASERHRVQCRFFDDIAGPFFGRARAEVDGAFARAGQPVDWTTNGLRDKYLLFVLLFPDCEGIVIVQSEGQQVTTVRFKVGDGES